MSASQVEGLVEDLQDRLRRIDNFAVSGRGRRKHADDAKAAQETEAKSSAATQLTELLLQAKTEFWHTPDRDPFATFTDTSGVVSHVAIQSSDFTELAQRLFYLKTGRAIASDAVKAAVNTVAADAKFAGNEHEVYSRIAHLDDAVWIDLGDETWQAVRIDASDWCIMDSKDVPIKFRRMRSTRPLPRPERNGTLDDIREIFPMDDTDWQLLLGWLVGIFQHSGGRAHLELIGQQGSGKSTLARYLVALTDPVTIPGRSVSKDEEALIIAVQGRSVLAFDNVSVLSPEMADAWCRLSTGGGLGKRKLHSDQEEILIKAQLPLVWTSIVPVAVSRPDLQDRTITVRLEALRDTEYRSEREIDEVFSEIHPFLLGALYDTISAALRNAGQVDLERRPRLADFAEWVEAAAPALGWQPGEFVSVLESSRIIASAQAVDSSAVGRLLMCFMQARSHWNGPGSDLLTELKKLAEDDVKRQRSFPKDATRLSSQIRRLQRPLAALGVEVKFDRTKRARDISITRNDDRFVLDHEATTATNPTLVERVRGATLPLTQPRQESQSQEDGWEDDRARIYGELYRQPAETSQMHGPHLEASKGAQSE